MKWTCLNTGISSDVSPVTTPVMSILHASSPLYIACLICIEHLSSDPISVALFVMSIQHSLSWPYGCVVESERVSVMSRKLVVGAVKRLMRRGGMFGKRIEYVDVWDRDYEGRWDRAVGVGGGAFYLCTVGEGVDEMGSLEGGGGIGEGQRG